MMRRHGLGAFSATGRGGPGFSFSSHSWRWQMAVGSSSISSAELWPALPIREWADTCATLHMWTQIVGKIRMELSPPINHWWHVTLYVTSRGLTTSPIPANEGAFEIEFDFIEHAL